MKRPLPCIAMLMLLTTAGLAHAQDSEPTKPPSVTPPHFASLRSNEANMRTGPGTRYPIEWTFTRQGLPVEIVADDGGVWRRVRDPDGDLGWVHKSELSSKRMAIVTGPVRNLMSDADDKAKVLAHLDAGALGQLVSCSKDWCKLKFDSLKGYLRKTQFWGAYPSDVFD